MTTTTTIPVIQENISELTKEEAAQVFDSLDVTQLTNDELVALVAQVQSAPPEVRAAFEKSVDIFSGKTDTYVPLGSKIPVGQRRVLIVVGVVTAMIPAARRRKW